MSLVYACDHHHDRPAAEVTALVGGKAANLTIMALDLGLPVPPAFTVTTEACLAYLAKGWPAGLDAELRAHMARMERLVGRRFGDPSDPLLVSVRSGAPVSMPGMMDTILNLGLNEATTAGLAAASGSLQFAANCRERFETMFRDIVGVAEIPEDPWQQLRAAIEAVFRSWNGDRARAYRQREGIPDGLGTAVTVQAMVYGNRSADSATGVLFTRNPATGEPVLYGDILFNAQGEDVVAGTHGTEPIAVLDERMPAVARELRAAADQLERHHADLCDIEFTIEHGRLWLLQCRVGKRSPRAALRIALDMAKAPDFPLTRAEAVARVAHLLADPPRIATGSVGDPPVAAGLPASPGRASGGVVVTPEAAVAAAEAGRDVILARAETSPDDVHGMAVAAGVLTSTGGLASHAAVVARGWGIPAVVGARDVRVDVEGIEVAGRRFKLGATITIDGDTGEVFAGNVATEYVVAPEAAVLQAWAAELGIPGDGRPADPTRVSAATEKRGGGDGRDGGDEGDAHPGGSSESPPRTGRAMLELAPDDVLTVVLVKGYATVEAAAAALAATAERVAAVIDALVADGLVEPSSGAFRLTAEGRERARAAVARAAAAWGPAAASAALDAFIALDQRMKATVTHWQVREAGDEQVLNDHADPEYDAGVLAELAALHADAVAWLGPVAEGLPRLRVYIDRLGRACASACAGDGRYVASPRVDSYHGCWFELHEDLILHAGRTRADEVAAGRA